MLPWWRHAGPSEAELRIIVVLDGPTVIGVAPFFMEKADGLIWYRPLGSGSSPRREPLAWPGRERRTAEVMAAVLAEAQPKPDLLTFEGVPASSPWPRLLRDVWPSKRPPWLHRDRRRVAPTLTLAGHTFDQWLASKSRNFRQQMGRARRQLDRQEAVFHLATSEEELKTRLPSFAALHHSRWASRGGSNILSRGVQSMLEDVARQMGTLRFRLWSIELDGQAISSHIFIAAGGELMYWLGGFDNSWSPQHPSILALLAAIEHSWEIGDRRVDFGAGSQPYKYRFANEEEILQRVILVPPGARRPMIQGQVLAENLDRALRNRLGFRGPSERGTGGSRGSFYLAKGGGSLHRKLA